MRTEEPLAISRIFFSFFFFLFIRQIQAESLQQACSSSCGEITNIRSPFRLKGDPIECGDHDFELSCQSNKTILEIDSVKLYVTRISHKERLISVGYAINSANGSCSFPNKSLSADQLDYGTNFIVLDRFDYEYSYATFLNCSTNISDSAYIRLPCFGNDQSYNVYVNFGTFYMSISDLPKSSYCSFISMVPVHRGDKQNSSYESIMQLLESGFQLRWSVKCRDCIAAHEICSFSDDTCYKVPMVFILARLILAAVLFGFLIHKWRSTMKKEDKMEKLLQNQQSWMPKRYSYAEIIAMTNNFKEKLGQGGFGSVYKGQLYTGYMIAVKLLKNAQFSAEEFINEVSTLGRIHHVNVVQLVGFCFEESKRALVYEYMPNGSLDKHIFSKGGRTRSFSWEKIYEIALGIARGIEYLHVGCDVSILHFDIKPHNILLDHDFTSKIADFGLAKLYPKENDIVSISATRGTIGYIAPEVISRNFGTVSNKSDVYSFGMLLLEMVGGRRNSDMRTTHSSKAYFPSWAYEQINRGGDLDLWNATEAEEEIARKLCITGLWCIQLKATDRPSMTKVLEMLEGSINNLQMPSKPFFSSSQHNSAIEIASESSAELLDYESIMEESSYRESDVSIVS